MCKDKKEVQELLYEIQDKLALVLDIMNEDECSEEACEVEESVEEEEDRCEVCDSLIDEDGKCDCDKELEEKLEEAEPGSLEALEDRMLELEEALYTEVAELQDQISALEDKLDK